MKAFVLSLTRPLVGFIFLSALAAASADLLREYLWTNRVVVTFSSFEKTPERLLLLRQIEEHSCEFIRRDLVHIDLLAGSIDYQSLSKRFSLGDDDFKLVKDGKTKLYTNSSALEEIFVLIDAMLMRKKEMRGEKCQ